ncbi:MAG: hypothetical protein R3B84_22910 [Zavarzinella sp.]
MNSSDFASIIENGIMALIGSYVLYFSYKKIDPTTETGARQAAMLDKFRPLFKFGGIAMIIFSILKFLAYAAKK